MSCSGCSQFVLSSMVVKFLHQVSFAVFEELVSLHPEMTLLLSSSTHWSHLYGSCYSEVPYTVAKVNLRYDRFSFLDGGSN